MNYFNHGEPFRTVLSWNSRCISDERGTNLRWLNGVIKIQDFGFALTRSAIGPSRHPLNQSDAKQKPITMWSSAFSRTFCTLPRFTLNSHWLMMKWIIVLNECFDYFSFCLFSTLNWKILNFQPRMVSCLIVRFRVVCEK